MQKKFNIKLNALALEKTLYVLGAGAFGVFIRWLQRQSAFDDNGLVNSRSLWNVLVLAIILAAFLVFRRFIKAFRKEGRELSEDAYTAFRAENKAFGVFRICLGGLMCVGAAVLFLTCETYIDVKFLKALAIAGFLSGLCFIQFNWHLRQESDKTGAMCLCAVVPVLTLALWLLTCYKMNDINSVVWDYGVEIVTLCVAMFAAFYVAGFVFSYAAPWKTLFFNMFAAFLLLMCLADERNMGMQLMLLAQAGMFVYYNWVMLENIGDKKKKNIFAPADDGFDRL